MIYLILSLTFWCYVAWLFVQAASFSAVVARVDDSPWPGWRGAVIASLAAAWSVAHAVMTALELVETLLLT